MFTTFITYSGKEIDLACMKESDVCLEDIAHHLAKICRYGGAVELGAHYSVAQHSIVLSQYARRMHCDNNLCKALLLHDASEAYLGDIVKGLKALLPDYRKLEEKVMKIIHKKYNVLFTDLVELQVKKLDTRILLDEALKFVPQHYGLFCDKLKDIDPLGVELWDEGYQWHDAGHTMKNMFLDYADKLGVKD